MSAIAIIPARGGSKRFPRKNIAPLLGRPVLGHTIAAALASGTFERVIVSTEDAEIAEVARQEGAEVDARDPGLATDDVGVVSVCRDLLGRLERADGLPATFCCLYATAALVTADDLRAARARLHPGQTDFVMAVTTYAASPFQALVADAQGVLTFQWPALGELPRRQLPDVVVDAGSIYWCTTRAFLAAGSFYGPGLRGYQLPRDHAVDLDVPEDLALAEFYARRRGGHA